MTDDYGTIRIEWKWTNANGVRRYEETIFAGPTDDDDMADIWLAIRRLTADMTAKLREDEQTAVAVRTNSGSVITS